MRNRKRTEQHQVRVEHDEKQVTLVLLSNSLRNKKPKNIISNLQQTKEYTIMNKEILKRNIEQVIMQPCNSKYPTEIKPNGLSEDGTHIMVKIRCDDSSSLIRLKWCNNGVYEDIDFVEEILKRMPEKYRDHLVTLKHDDWISYSYVPVFDTDTQAMWDKELDTFYKKKQEWCDKYGCE